MVDRSFKHVYIHYFVNLCRARVQIYSLSLIFKLWYDPFFSRSSSYVLNDLYVTTRSLPHYRNKSYQQDMIDNLRNVAIPGTGIRYCFNWLIAAFGTYHYFFNRLSLFCHSYWTCLFFVLFLNPIICFFGAIHKANRKKLKSWDAYAVTVAE